MPPSPLDTVDWAILHHLQEDARQPVTAIADAVNLADNTVRNRIEKLEEAGIIEGYQANINYDAAAVEHHYVFICTARVGERERLADEVRQLPGVVEVLTLMTGRRNVHIIGVGSAKDDMTELAYKVDDLGLAIEWEHLVRDHYRQPFEGFQLDRNL